MPPDGAIIPADGYDDGAIIPADGYDDGAIIPADGAIIPADGAIIPADGAIIPADGAIIPPDDGATANGAGAITPLGVIINGCGLDDSGMTVGAGGGSNGVPMRVVAVEYIIDALPADDGTATGCVVVGIITGIPTACGLPDDGTYAGEPDGDV